MNEDFFENISNTGNPIEYADTVQRYQTQLPLGISWPTVTGSLNPSDLYTDDTSLYMYYPSGLNKTAVAIQQRDRYGGITFTLISGSTNLYIQASEFFADPNPAFISSPYTVSGEGGTNLISASYLSDTPENPQNYWINLPNPGTYKVVFPNPVISTAFSVTHSGSSPYVFSQMLPRKSIGSYDIDVNSIRAYHVTASFIDAVALQVSDSIVVGPDLIGAKSIDGSKIIDGTLSGVLIQNGTVTGNKILAGTISGSLIQAGTITADNIASNTITASKIAGATITFNEIASNTLTAAQIADGAITGRKILDGTISGVLIQDDAISASKIQANSITAAKIAAGTITGDKITAGTISGELITAGSITSNQIAVSGITADNISARVITAEKIVLSGITAELLGAEAVTAAALASGAVISGKIAADSIYASNIVGGQITGYHVAANTITGDKIQANTISGALMTAGTITANEIAVGSISADRLNVTQLDAVAANMGTVTINSGISVGTDGYITVPSGYIEAGKARLDSTGLQIGNVASSNLPSITDTLRIAGSGIGGNIVGMALYNGAFSATVPQALMQLDGTNALEIENNAPESALINLNFPANGLSQGATVNVYNGSLHLKNTSIAPADIKPGVMLGWDRNNQVRYELGPDQLRLNNGSSNTFVVNSSNGSITTSGGLYVGGITTADNSIDVNGSVVTEFAVKAKSELNVGFDGSVYAFNVNTAGQIASKVMSTEMGYLTARRTATLAITTAGTTITWQAYPRYNNISVAGSEITIDNAGYYVFSATFATVANLATLRMTLQRTTISYVSTLHGAGLATGGGYIFNFTIGFWSPANTDYRVVLTPSANTTLNANNEGFAAPSPILNIFQAIGDIE